MSDMQLAATILEQLGGNRFIVMTGARDFLGAFNALTFRIPTSPRNRANAVRITLDPSDTYSVEFMTVRRNHVATVGPIYAGIYGDALPDLFTRVTGLETSLGTLGRTVDVRI